MRWKRLKIADTASERQSKDSHPGGQLLETTLTNPALPCHSKVAIRQRVKQILHQYNEKIHSLKGTTTVHTHRVTSHRSHGLQQLAALPLNSLRWVWAIVCHYSMPTKLSSGHRALGIRKEGVPCVFRTGAKPTDRPEIPSLFHKFLHVTAQSRGGTSWRLWLLAGVLPSSLLCLGRLTPKRVSCLQSRVY